MVVVVRVATIAVDVTVRGLAKALSGVGTFNDRLKAMRKSVKLGTDGLLKMWVAFQFLTSSSSVAAAVLTGFGAALGFIIDVILLPFLPLLIEIELALFRFGQWFSQQGPEVRSALLLIGGALLIAFGGGVATAIGVILVLLGLMYAWSTAQASVTIGALLGLAGVILLLAIKFNLLSAPVYVVVGALLVLVGVVLLLRAAWLALNGEEFRLPSLDDVRSAIGMPAGGLGPTSAPPIPPMNTLGGIGGGVGSIDQSIGPVYVNTIGSSQGGRDAGLALQNDMMLRRRMA